ncbi:hypothetical protein B0I35DRAFT_478643 [Stachybotrys elegans]|uniref:F-box domain-containing protein n=1 Tax=Stachybotrys elegans TaxID=80388 RepID=A0A8K0SLG3_9HYPO|nr:hypothetical protein B0I35DRAFT_478643 [Stachybotrys elegans]
MPRILFKPNRALIQRVLQHLHIPRRSKPQPCYLLDMPQDVILHILGFLGEGTHILLSQTCTALRRIIAHIPLANLYREQRLDLLLGLSRDLPDRWVCEICVRLHATHPQDTWAEPWHTTCPAGWRQHKDLNPCGLDMSFRHVQLALKYSRIGCNPSYVENLLVPRPQEVKEDFGWQVGWESLKIVDGRSRRCSVSGSIRITKRPSRGSSIYATTKEFG